MNTISRTITGLAFALFGAYLLFLVIPEKGEELIFGGIMGLLLIGLGGFIFFNKKEDNIEQINE